MSLSEYEKNDPSFIADLRKSKEAVAVAAKWLSELGYPVIVRPTFERPNVEQMGEFSDDGDLEIIQRIEIKRRQNLTFTSKLDFPYETIIVDACHCYDNARPKPFAYIIFNREMNAAFVINVKATVGEWVKVEKWDSSKGRNRSFYECPLKLVSFVTMPQVTVSRD